MPRKVYTHEEATIVFQPPSQAGVVNFAPVISLLSGSGVISDPYDFGTGARPSLFEWRARSVTAPGVNVGQGATIDIYLATSDDGVWFDGNLASGNRVLSDPYKVANLKYVGALTVEELGTGVTLVSSGLVQVFGSKAALVWWNNSGASLSAASGDHQFYLKPVPDEIQ